MPTIVRIEKALVQLTPEGWKSEDPEIERLCQTQMETGAGGFHWDRNPNKAMAEMLVAAFTEEGIDAEIISIER